MNCRFIYSYLKDVLVREPLFRLRYYRLMTKKVIPCIVFMADGRMPHGGMFDRFKGIVTTYGLAKQKGIPFKIHWICPFNLSEYLIPNEVNWIIDDSDVIFSLFKSRPLIVYGESSNPKRLWTLNVLKQVHVYYGADSLEKMNKLYFANYEWGVLFKKLFSPSQRLRSVIDAYKEKLNNKYISIHFRFQNLLGDKNEIYDNKVLSKKDQERLIQKCKASIDRILKDNEGYNVFVASDSDTFLSLLKSEFKLLTTDGKSVHIDNIPVMEESDIIKSFVDFYLISESSYVYSVKLDDMYSSAFPHYAAKINNRPFKRIEK